MVYGEFSKDDEMWNLELTTTSVVGLNDCNNSLESENIIMISMINMSERFQQWFVSLPASQMETEHLVFVKSKYVVLSFVSLR